MTADTYAEIFDIVANGEPQRPTIECTFDGLPSAYTSYRTCSFDANCCRGSVNSGSFNSNQCSRTPKYFEPARWYERTGEVDAKGYKKVRETCGVVGWCGTHAPSKVAEREEAKRAAANAQYQRETAARDRETEKKRVRHELARLAYQLGQPQAPDLTTLRSDAQGLVAQANACGLNYYLTRDYSPYSLP